MPVRRARAVSSRMRNGFSLIEALVALVLFEIGMLALAATTAVAARDLGAATRRARAVTLAYNAVEQMRVGVCVSPSGDGQRQQPGGYTEFWRVEVAGPRRVITDSVVFTRPVGGPGHVVARAEALCPA